MKKKGKKSGRTSNLLKFPEIQAIVNDEIWRYIYENRSSYTKIAEMTNLSKARFSELKKINSSGRFMFELSESVLDPLVGRNIVPLDKVMEHIVIDDTETGKSKAEWAILQGYLKDLKALRSKKYPVQELLNHAKKEAGVE
jgi:hypothetical protein